MMKKNLAIILHGGAGETLSKEKASAIRAQFSCWIKKAYKKLCGGMSAVDCVTELVSAMESDSLFNAGYGSMLQRDGRARLSAALMDGSNLRFAGVINVESLRHPIQVARALLQEKDRVLAGHYALRYALSHGFRKANVISPHARILWRTKIDTGSDTVGACVLDARGRLASATSTGGRGYELPGRVSDSAMPVGNYASPRGAVSATGIGEEIMIEGLAVKIVARIEDGLSLRQAFQKTFAQVRINKRRIGAIGLDHRGNWFQDTTTKVMSFAAMRNGHLSLF